MPAALAHDPPLVHDQYAVGERLDLGQIAAGQQHGAPFGQLGQRVPQRQYFFGIQLVARLVDKQRARPEKHGLRHAHHAAHAPGQPLDRLVGNILEIHQLKGVIDHFRGLAPGIAAGVGQKFQIGARRHVLIDGRLAGHIADLLARLRRLRIKKDAVDFHLPAVSLHRAGNNIHRGGFARAAQARQRADLALFHIQRQTTERVFSPIGLFQIFDLNHQGSLPIASLRRRAGRRFCAKRRCSPHFLYSTTKPLSSQGQTMNIL